jgi:hypothetical protein
MLYIATAERWSLGRRQPVRELPPRPVTNAQSLGIRALPPSRAGTQQALRGTALRGTAQGRSPRHEGARRAAVAGPLATAQGARQVTILLDTGVTHCFICARLAAGAYRRQDCWGRCRWLLRRLMVSGLVDPVLVYLCLSDTFRESMSISPLTWKWVTTLSSAGRRP